MKAIILENAGGIENLITSKMEQPVLKQNEVLVKVKAISINPVDYKVRAMDFLLDMIYGKERPAILGWDIAGTVEATGNDVSKFKIGDKVFGMVNFPGSGKAYAEYVASPEEQLALMPENATFEESAATTLAALTALQAFQGRIKQGDRVLIHAGSGGVGHYAIQIAKHMGAYVITTSSAKNRDFVVSMGADEHINYRTQAFEEVVSDIDFVMDGIGEEVMIKSMKVLKEGGILVSLPTPQYPEEVQEEAKKLGINLVSLMVTSNGDDMNTLKGYMEQGILKAHVSKTFSFDQLGESHNEIASGRTVGKIVVTV